MGRATPTQGSSPHLMFFTRSSRHTFQRICRGRGLVARPDHGSGVVPLIRELLTPLTVFTFAS